MDQTQWPTHERVAMRRALELAAGGPEADPNPRVGCVLLDADGATVGEGWHEGAGTDHAEVVALKAAGELARGGTAVVTLEPCNHTGRTGPCAQALIAAGVSRVVFAQADPTAQASGGAATLRAAGIRVETGLLAHESAGLNHSWTFAQKSGRPWVSWKFAATLDGRSAAADGSSQWITGPVMRRAMNQRRARCGAVVVGTGTVLSDDPRLTVRDEQNQPMGRQPLRVVVGDRPVPAEARVRGTDSRFRQLPGGKPQEVLQSLSQQGIHHVWLEGGPALAAAWWRAGVIDEVICCLAPALLGAGKAAVADLGITTIADIARLHLVDVERHGEDVALILNPIRNPKEK
ncbi:MULTISPECIES: bifunctional diaminohydroxyphosphoribosylaminopyrimidine deaminase/5-amino-6-(5-phosphoribosylamino)uracil reductase RibD [unclassified Luteococcus]|uniref:bifunctional diaminohydroxyphosphoribosylaminopyrimidine deaminase/5-amino-6-(5-phosphoribosylamino)uracil reductase RibD n=1 Tax=unclassified Luteococcus TaxID=2639923 RepID=UPI00313B38F8